MVRTNISNLKNRLSHYLRLVRAGEVVEITDRKMPLARIEAIDAFSPGNILPTLQKRGFLAVMITAWSPLPWECARKGQPSPHRK